MFIAESRDLRKFPINKVELKKVTNRTLEKEKLYIDNLAVLVNGVGLLPTALQNNTGDFVKQNL